MGAPPQLAGALGRAVRRRNRPGQPYTNGCSVVTFEEVGRNPDLGKFSCFTKSEHM
jgi:hypothetical protein